MVDNRELANHKRRDPSLPHWPAAARWWHSRLKLIGPHKEKTELFLFPISAATGLHHVHPSWADTFALAAPVATFPGINFVYCWIAIVCRLPCLELKTCGRRLTRRYPAHSESGIPKTHPLRNFECFRTEPTGGVHTASCLQHSNGARGLSGD